MTTFSDRHNGPDDNDVALMLKKIGVGNIDSLIGKIVPSNIRSDKPLNLPEGIEETDYLDMLREIGKKNRLFRSFIGQGYYGVAPLSVITRNVLENPAWYTSYTPYQAEISQGRLEALLNFQTMICDLTGMAIANSSLLDESTSVAEAMVMCYGARSRASVKEGVNKFFVDENIFLQDRDLLVTRSNPLNISLVFGNYKDTPIDNSFFGAFVRFPAASGEVRDYRDIANRIHAVGGLLVVAADLMSLAMLSPPGEWGADIVVGSNQRFGLSMSYGGPHAGYLATKESLKRSIPGRLVGVSIDSNGNPALRLALQTREQHIKRERATSNICTAQALLASMSGMFAQYHGPQGIKKIASRIHESACKIDFSIRRLGFNQVNDDFFDTLDIYLPSAEMVKSIKKLSEESGINFFYPGGNRIILSSDEITSEEEIATITSIFEDLAAKTIENGNKKIKISELDRKYLRQSPFLTAGVFNRFRSETGLMRYIKMLERKDFSLANGMIPLGSCTMKLNSATSMFAMSWPEFANVHPFVPAKQALGYKQIIDELGEALKEITGFSAISFQPNSGAAGEYAGMLVIREYHLNRGEETRNVVLIPASAHGTNPASAVMAGMNVVVVGCDNRGNVDFDDLMTKVESNSDRLAALMLTYPSTHGVYEDSVLDIIDKIHAHGGLVYMDGANMNAQVGITSPGRIGADICHLNLHKTFGIPHGGGGPGEGPILCTDELADFLPSHPVVQTGGNRGISGVSAAPFGSAHILTISHAYVKMLGGEGLTKATKYALLNANYISFALKDYFKTLYVGHGGFVAHELILDLRCFGELAGISEADVAKRLMDYGFHAPTLSFPVHGTLMVEPTESEPLEELDRFIDAMISIYREIDSITRGVSDKEDNPLHNAPHTSMAVSSDKWEHSYSRQQAAFPRPWVAENKFWPAAGRVDDGYGDRNLDVTNSSVDRIREGILDSLSDKKI